MGVLGTGLFYVFIFLPTYFLFTILQRFYWLCNGMNDIVNQIESGQLYERSAQVMDIRWKMVREAFQLISHQNFIATHRSFEHPKYVLKNNVSILSVSTNSVVFVEVPEDYNIYDCRQSPFIHFGQFKEATKIITMPISSLIQLTNDIGDPKTKVIWLHSTGRCGSTALGQVFDVVPNCITISEPMSMFTYRAEIGQTLSTNKFKQMLASSEYSQLLRAIVRALTKPNIHNPDTIFIKDFTLLGVNDVQRLETLFPDHIHLFLYRDCLPTVQSYLRSLNSHFWIRFVMSLRSNFCLRFLIRSPAIFMRAIAAPEVVDRNQWVKHSSVMLNMTDFGLFVIQWCVMCDMYIMMFNSGKSKVRALRYEDLINQKEETLALLFQFCDIPLENVELAKKSLESDSQEGTVLSVSTLKKFKKVHVTEDMTAEANFYLRGFNLSLLDQPALLPGALSPVSAVESSKQSSYIAIDLAA